MEGFLNFVWHFFVAKNVIIAGIQQFVHKMKQIKEG